MAGNWSWPPIRVTSGWTSAPKPRPFAASASRGDASKLFLLLDDYAGQTADLSLSLDVLFHLVEDGVYFDYLDRLFKAGRRFVVVYATSVGNAPRTLRHVRHRPVESDIATRFPDFARLTDLEAMLPAPPRAQGEGGYTRFFIYQRRGQ